MNKKDKCKCPYCENELENSCFEPVFCQPCKTKFIICAQCNTPYKSDLKKCPKCNKGGK